MLRHKSVRWGAAIGLLLVCLVPLRAGQAQEPSKLIYEGSAVYAPFEYLDESGQPRGFLVELIRELSRESGVPVEIRLAPSGQNIRDVEQGKVDFITLAYSDQRAKQFDLGIPIWTIHQSVVLRGTRARYPERLDQLSNEVVAVLRASATEELLKSLPEVQRPVLRVAGTMLQAMESLQRGDVTAVALNTLSVRFYARRMGLTGLTVMPLRSTTFHFTTRRGQGSRIQPLEDALTRLRQNGRFDQLVEEHLSISEPHNIWRDYVLPAVLGLAISFVLLMAVSLWNYSLRRQVRARTRDLQQSQQAYEALVNTLDSIVWEMDPETYRFTFVSRQAERILGYPVQEWLEPGFWSRVVLDEDRQQAFDFCVAEIAQLRDHQFEYRMRAADGRVVWIRDIVTVIAENGRVAKLRGLLLDITESKRAAEALRESQARLQAAVENLPLGFWICDVEGRCTMQNPTSIARWGNQLGLRLEEMDLPEAVRSLWAGSLHRAQNGEVVREESVLNLPAGPVHGFHVHAPIREGGQIIGTMGVSIDISEQKRAQEALRLSEERLKLALEGSADGWWDWDVATGALDFSPQLPGMLGYQAGEYEKSVQWIRDRVHPEDLPAVIHGLEEHLRQNTPFYEAEMRLRTKDGEWKWVLDRGKVVQRGAGGKPLRATGTHKDISSRKQLEEQLLQAQKMEAVGQLAGGLAHDFNNLLTVISGYAALLLQDQPAPDRVRKAAEAIEDATTRASALTRQLLAFSRRQMMQPRLLDLNAVVASMEGMLRRLLEENIRMSFYPAPGLGKVRADLGQLEQVIMNLAVNARDAMPQGGQLTLATSEVAVTESGTFSSLGLAPGHYTVLVVRDTGVGMDAQTRRRIFEPFFTTKAQQGTGLGLATVYGIVQQSGGAIEVESEPQRGSTFRIYLPSVQGEVGTPLGEIAAPAAAGSETILLVEDEPGLRELLEQFLRGAGYHVLSAGNGEEALSLAARQKGPIHLLLTDVMMPGISGLELSRQLVEERPAMSVLYISGYAGRDLVGGNQPAKGHFLQKPFGRPALLGKVRAVLDE